MCYCFEGADPSTSFRLSAAVVRSVALTVHTFEMFEVNVGKTTPKLCFERTANTAHSTEHLAQHQVPSVVLAGEFSFGSKKSVFVHACTYFSHNTIDFERIRNIESIESKAGGPEHDERLKHLARSMSPVFHCARLRLSLTYSEHI